MRKLFGTDGIRGVANEYPIIPEMAVKIGKAVASILREKDRRSKIVIGKDTRISGDILEYAMASGIASMGVDVYLTGILPTPGIAFITASTRAGAGIVISASHNPFYDNGIKVFKGNGYKLSDEKELEIERLVLDESFFRSEAPTKDMGRIYKIEDSGSKYAKFLEKTLPEKKYFKGFKIIMDCSNGATYNVAPRVFKELGADIEALFVNPDGKNINDHCGSQHPDTLKKKVLEKEADIGLAFDGDGDRLIAVDETGNVTTGDQIIAICAKFMKKKGLLNHNRVVSTVMSNMGLGLALKEIGIKHVQTKVGDRYVVEKMISSGAVLGGEDSGHMIFLNHQTTGDGILTAIKLMEVMKETSKPLSELGKVMRIFPQILINVNVKHKPELNADPDIESAVKAVEKNLGEKGRVLVRYSGTRPVCRVMVEGPTVDKTKRYCQKIAGVIKDKLG